MEFEDQQIQDNAALPSPIQELPFGGIASPINRGIHTQEILEQRDNKAAPLPRSRTVFNCEFNQARYDTNSTTPKDLFAANINRQYLLIQNKSTSAIFLNFGAKGNALNGLEIPAGESYAPPIAPINSVSMIGAQIGGSQSVVAIQGIV